ncbi:MAG: ATPase [Actinobacteria bacterium]|nr:ATPase [Actinomycetota bacterium]
MDLAARLQQLEDLVREAKSMPLSSSALVNREEVLELLQEMKELLPEEIKQARWIVKDREELLAKARAEGERIVQEAREEQLRLARREEVLARAKEEAEHVTEEAEEQGRRMRQEAEDYVDGKLAQFEIALRKIQEEARTSTRQVARTLDQIELGRQKLRGAPTTEAEQRLGSREIDEEPPPSSPPPREIDIEVQEEQG